MKYLGFLSYGFASVLLLSSGCFADDNPNFRFQDYSQGGVNSSAPAPAPPSPASTPTSNASDPDPKNEVSPAPYVQPQSAQMRVETNIRPAYGLGTSITAYGGANVFQEGTLKITSPAVPGAEIRGDTQSVVGGVAGIKIGFTWPSFDAIGSDPQSVLTSSPGPVEPCIAADFFWSGYRYEASGSGTTSVFGVPTGYNGTIRADVDTYTFCLEPTVKFNLGPFRPYLGFGVGGTYVEASHASVNGNLSALGGTLNGTQNLTGSSSDVDFTAEGLAGAEFFFARNWALNLEYKFLYLVSPTFHGNVPGSTINYHLSGLGESLFTGGISFYF